MKPHYLTPLLAPRTVAIIGASDTPGSIGQTVFSNLMAGGYQGKLYPVNLNRRVVGGMGAVANIKMLEVEIDLAVITTAIRSLPGVMKDCAKKGVKAVLLTREFSDADPLQAEVMAESLAIAKAGGVRVLGPNMLGLMRPVIGLNASNYSAKVRPGNLALVAHSSALCTAMLDWADAKGMGFSSVISMGESSDIDFGEILDFLVADGHTQGILLHVNSIHDARRFMSSLRAVARGKPVVVVKSGRYLDHHDGMTSATNLVGRGDVFDAALARAGVLRVNTISQLFSGARVLAANYRSQGRRLAIITNGIGPGVLAADSTLTYGVQLAELSPATLALLNDTLPRNWSHANPVDIIGDAGPARFRTAVKACLDDSNVDGVLVIFTPQAGTDHQTTADLMVGLQKTSSKPLLLSWLGDSKVASSRETFARAKIAHFNTPEAAVAVFRGLASFHANQQLLLQTPGPLQQAHLTPDIARAQAVIDIALAEHREVLSERESKEVLDAFNIPVNPTRLAKTAEQAIAHAEVLGYPVVLKIDSPDVIYKSDVGGVELNIINAATVREAFNNIVSRTQAALPTAHINGVSVQPMVKRRSGRELMIGVAHDNTFGPIITFGGGGIAAEVQHDNSLALPPLNDFLADQLIARTKVSRTLAEFKHMPAVDMATLKGVLGGVSEMICELPDLLEMDINPLVVDDVGGVVLDARIVVRKTATTRRYGHMAIMPYPSEMVEQMVLNDGTEVTIRPMRPEDAEMQQEFVRNLSEESRYNRYMSSIKQLSQPVLVRFTQLDFDREMALVMVRMVDGREEQIGVSCYFTDPDNESCEFALVVADNWQGRGIGPIMMNRLFDAAKKQGLTIMRGEVLANNKGMLKLMAKIGFTVSTHPEDRQLTWVTRPLL